LGLYKYKIQHLIKIDTWQVEVESTCQNFQKSQLAYFKNLSIFFTISALGMDLAKY
jgi:hypothetical protein